MSALAVVESSAAPRPVARARPTVTSVRYRADAVLWALALMHVTYVWRLPSLMPVLKPLHLGITSGMVAFTLFLLDRRPRRRLAVLPMRPVWYAAALLAMMVLSVPAGLNPAHSAKFMLQMVVPNLVLMLMVAASVRSLADIEWLGMMHMLAAAGYGVFVLLKFPVDASGRLGDLIYYDTNDLGLVLVATMPLVVYFASRGQRWGRRLAAAACAPIFLVLLVRTGSRGAFLGLLAVAAYLTLNYRGFNAVPKRLVVAGIGAIAFLLLGGNTYLARMETLLNPTADYNWTGRSPTGRLEIWKRGIGYLLDHPVVGVGVANFERAEGTLSDIGHELESRGEPFKWSVAHNSYLETAAEAGAVALLMWIGLFATVLLALRRVVRAAGRLSFVSRELVLAQTLSAALLGYLVCAFFISAEYFTYPYVLLGLAIGLLKTTRLAGAIRRVA